MVVTESQPLLTAEVAERLRCSTAMVLKLAKAGKFPGAFRVGAEWRFPSECVDSYVSSQKGKANGS